MTKENQLIQEIQNGNVPGVEQLLKDGAKASYQDEETGRSCLIEAAIMGNKEILSLLIQNGAPWNAVDKKGKCAGDYAIDNNDQDAINLLMNAAVTAEMILGSLENKVIERYGDKKNTYLENNDNIEYTDKNLIDKEKEHAVMMEWEKPLMDIHAKVICSNLDQKDCIRVLNVGYGLGLVDRAIQEYAKSCQFKVEHVIIEAHPKVIEKMKADGVDKLEGVQILEGKWQDVLAGNIGKFDGIFFDTYGEYYRDMQMFQKQLPLLLHPRGIYSYFNGLCPHNVFFHAVCCEVVKLELQSIKFEVHFEPVDMDKLQQQAKTEDVLKESTWKEVKAKYWFMDTYHVPICINRG